MAVTIDAYDQLIELMSDGTIDMDDATADTFKGQLCVDGAGGAFVATETVLTDVTEIATGNGYTAKGTGLTSVTWAHTTGTVKWDSADVTWTASGGPIPASGSCGAMVIYDETTTSPLDALMIHVDFGADEAAGDGTQFIVAPDATNGWFTGSFTGA